MICRDEDVRVVLVRPRNPVNIGASARAIRNFGFSDLVLVAPHEPVWEESRSAPGAEQLLHQARVVPKLLDAIEDRTLVIGTSSLSRRTIEQPVISLHELAGASKKRAGGDRVAVVFGSEKNGLSKQDLSYCHLIVRIPTDRDCPSMNLAQAVAVCCYELRRAIGIQEQVGSEKSLPAAVGEVERLVDEIEKVIGTETAGTAAGARKARLRQMLLGWPMTSEQVALALGILRDVAWQKKEH